MRLSHDKARRLTLLLWRDRARRWLPAAASVALLAGLLAALFLYRLGHLDRTVAVQYHDGTVSGLESIGIGRAVSVVRVHLDNGRDVDASGAFRVVPEHGAHVRVAEERHASGHLTYRIFRVLDR